MYLYDEYWSIFLNRIVFTNWKFAEEMLGVESQISGLWASVLTIALTWQVIMKRVKVCDQQSMSNHFGLAENPANFEKVN